MNIAIITVTLNAAAGLANTYASLKIQESSNFEWVVIDGHSQDSTLDFLANLPRDDFKKTILSREPKGIYDAMNYAVEKIDSSWLLFLNSGDVLLNPDSIKNMEKSLDTFPNSDCIAFPVAHIAPGGYLYDVTIPRFENSDFVVNHQGALISKRVFHLMGGYDTNLKWAADGKLLDCIGKFSVVDLAVDLEVGFEMGGLSSKHFGEVLKEISTYRHVTISTFSRLSTRVKHSLRYFALIHQGFILRRIFLTYFKSRQKRILKSIQGNHNLNNRTSFPLRLLK